MKKLQQQGEYAIYEKRSGRYAVRDRNKNWVNAEEKTKILLEAGLIRMPAKRPEPAAEPEEEAASESPQQGGAAQEG